MSSKTVSSNKYLSELGLLPDEIAIYKLLLSKGSLSANAISEQLGIIVNSIYRSTNTLIDNGLIKALDVKPRQFQAISPSVAIKKMAEKRIGKIKNVSDSAISHLDIRENPNRLNMDLQTGREELFKSFVEFANEANQEILVISIGEAVSESIWSAMKEAVEREIEAKFIFHKHDKDNILLIKRWQAMGVPIRHLPGEGYHLNIFDHSAAILSASNKKQSRERTGVIIYNEAIIEVLRSYFFQQWAVAKPV